MSEYSAMALVVVALATAVDVGLKTRVVTNKRFFVLLAIMSAITLLATQFLDGLPIVEYNDANTAGLRIGYMPIEDLSYTVAVCILIPSLWKRFNDKS